MASADEVQQELMGANLPVGHHAVKIHENGPAGLGHTAYTVQDKVSQAAHETTLWLDGRTLDHEAIVGFLANPGRRDTTLGHAINAASLARVNYLILKRLAAKSGVDISDIK